MFDLRMPLIDTRSRDLRRAAQAAQLAAVARNSADGAVTVRSIGDDDADVHAVAALAALDSRPVPARPVLVAEVDGELRAAMSLDDGAVVADPFRPTADLVDLLQARAGQLA